MLCKSFVEDEYTQDMWRRLLGWREGYQVAMLELVGRNLGLKCEGENVLAKRGVKYGVGQGIIETAVFRAAVRIHTHKHNHTPRFYHSIKII